MNCKYWMHLKSKLPSGLRQFLSSLALPLIVMVFSSESVSAQFAGNTRPMIFKVPKGQLAKHEPKQSDDILLELTPSWQSTDEDDRYGLAVGDLTGDGYPEIYSACGIDTSDTSLEGRDRAYLNVHGELDPNPWWLQTPPIPCFGADLGDWDTDGDLDVAIANSNGGAVYRNNNGILGLYAVWMGVGNGYTKGVAWAWVTQDPYPELACVNDDSASLDRPSTLFENTLGALSIIPVWSNQAGRDWCCAWGDVDNDGDPDLCIGTFDGPCNIYKTTNGHLENWASWTSFLNDGVLSVAFADINADGWLDVIVGCYDTPNRVYYNMGNGDIETSPSWSSTIVTDTWQLALGDIDNDGDIDLACGAQGNGDLDVVFENTGSELNPVPTWTSGLPTNTIGMVLADIDLDGDLDLVTAQAGHHICKYENMIQTANASPSPPIILNSQVTATNVTLTWGDGSDDHTPANLLTYNLRVGTAPGLADVIYAELDTVNTHPCFGNTWHAKTKTLTNLDTTTYYWSVQTVDAGYRRSVWAMEQSFEFTGSAVENTSSTTPQNYRLNPVFPNPFNPTVQSEFYLPYSCKVELVVYNTLGQQVATIINGNFTSGCHRFSWNGLDSSGKLSSSGLYFFVLRSELGTSIQKALLIR
jgi:hypothetical protein